MIQSTGDFSGKPFATIDLERSEHRLSDLHAQVLRHHGRIELVCPGGVCVLISREELQSLEQALEILSRTDAVRAMQAEVAQVARAAATGLMADPPQFVSR